MTRPRNRLRDIEVVPALQHGGQGADTAMLKGRLRSTFRLSRDAKSLPAGAPAALAERIGEFIALDSPPISETLASAIASRLLVVAGSIKNRDTQMQTLGLDRNVHGNFWLGDYNEVICERLARGDRRMFDRLRLNFVFSGWPIAIYRRVHTFPFLDPTYSRYLKLRAGSPRQFHAVAPPVCGEAGWRLDGGIVNHDVAIAQERLLMLHFIGAFDTLGFLQGKATCLEIGAGIGLFAHLFRGAFPDSMYVICDLPEILTQAFAYLNVAAPHANHFVATPEGLTAFAPGRRVDLPRQGVREIRSGFVYIPNYLMPIYEPLLSPNLVLNAMSLPEMSPAQIDYYASLASELVRRSNGAFIEFSDHGGQSHELIRPKLSEHFQISRSFDFIDLGYTPTAWSHSSRRIDDMQAAYDASRRNSDLDFLFEFEFPFEAPRLSDGEIQALLDEDFDGLIGEPWSKWMKDRGYTHANHLWYLRNRRHLPN